MPVLVVGATGALGSEICRRLAAGGRAVRALVRTTSDPTRVEALRAMGAETVVGDLLQRASLERACEGAEVVFSTATSIARDGAISAVDEQGQLDLVDAARRAGVRRFVYLSFEEFRSGAPLERAKRAVEEALVRSGMTFTILQPGLFHESWLTPMVGFDAPNGRLTVYGAGDRELHWIALDDVATAAVAALDEPATENAVVPLAGEHLSYDDVVATFESASGRPLEVQRVPTEALEARRDASAEERERSFAGLMLGVAAGAPPNDGTTWLRKLGVDEPVTVQQVARQQLEAR